ncbi:alpha amylase C-terminal domain-containing protein [Roseimarinus sediminis]|uniref:alpha amylase C-terminal domain-containing protein n=1 Tax=Roseimarinus sediminis TaxID=1610899 RepID=UPI003D1E094A
MEKLRIIRNDPWLEPYEKAFIEWHEQTKRKEAELSGTASLSDFASGYLYFGLHRCENQWCLREWAPNASSIYLIGTFNSWNEEEAYRMQPVGNGNWELNLDENQLKHGDLYALSMHWNGGSGKRIPAWAQRVVQDPDTHIFNAEVWAPPTSYEWKNKLFERSEEAPLIYEAHIGMAGEEERVHSYNEFRTDMLPRIKDAGYNVIQLMAIPEHPYYGSFGYHVSSFFAASSRFGTPDELKQLIDEAHGMGIAVIMDLIHSHAVKNELEGLGRYDGTRYQFFHEGNRGEHPSWDSLCFDYSKNEVLHFLLSNIKYWLEEYRFDGYRFDGVTSMLYFDHGLGTAFGGYDDYFSPNLDYEAVVYFKLANQLMHELKPRVLSIAEDVSGLPGLAAPLEDGGLGFDYRMSMGVPDYWIKLIKEKKDEEWEVGDIFHQMTAHRNDEKVVSYAESHDQALVGDKTIIFRLIDKEMYFSMRKDQPNLTVERGIALHKMIRLLTASCAGGAYLNFMGNEFGHPEWIDFPREGNHWSYRHARRLWSLADNYELRFHWLKDFDQEMIALIKKHELLTIPEIWKLWENKADQVLAYQRGSLLFVFNFNAHTSFTDYGIPMEASKFKVVLNTDAGHLGGYERFDDRITYYTIPSDANKASHQLRLYLPARSALVFEKEAFKQLH